MATMTMALSHEEPILSKLDRLDNMLRQLEEIRGSNRSSSSPPKSSYASTRSSGTLTSEGHASSIDDVSPKSLEKHCRPIDHVTVILNFMCVYKIYKIQLRQLEEIRGSNRSSSSPPKSSYASTRSSGTLTSEGHASSIDDVSPKSLEKHCRPIDHVMLEMEVKGTLIERIHRVEDRVLKMEEELIEEEKHKETTDHKKSHSKKGIKQLVRQCVKGGKRKTDY